MNDHVDGGDPVTDLLNMRRSYYMRLLASGKPIPDKVMQHIRDRFPSLVHDEHGNIKMSTYEFVDALKDFIDEYGHVPRSKRERDAQQDDMESYLHNRIYTFRDKVKDDEVDQRLLDYVKDRGMDNELIPQPSSDDLCMRRVKAFYKNHGRLPRDTSDRDQERELGEWIQDVVRRFNKSNSPSLRMYIVGLSKLN